MILGVYNAPGRDRKLGESQGIHFHLFQARAERIEPSYDQKREFKIVKYFRSIFVGLLGGIEVPGPFQKLEKAWSFHVSKFGPRNPLWDQVMTKNV